MSIPNPVVLLDARARYVHPAFQMSRASTKTVFDAAGRMVTVPANALGWDHDPVTGQARGYLAEPSATNLLLHSNDLSESAWGKSNSSITANAITGPDGTGMAKLVENDAEAEHYLLQSNSGATQPGVPITGSVIVRAAERENIMLRLTSVATSSNRVQLRFDAAAGQIVATGTNGDGVLLGAGSEDLGNGFHRVWLSGTIGATADDPRFVVFLRESPDGWGNIYKGDGTSGLYVGYCQVEEGSYPTSYIETGAATATRAADSLILPDLLAFLGGSNSRFTILVDVVMQQNGQSGDLWSIRTNSLRLSQANNGSTVRLAGAVLDSSPIIVNNIEAERYLIACAFEVGGSASAACNGAIAGNTQFTGSLSSPFTFGLGVRTGGGSELAGHISRAVYYPTRLSNADLQSLTAIQE